MYRLPNTTLITIFFLIISEVSQDDSDRETGSSQCVQSVHFLQTTNQEFHFVSDNIIFNFFPNCSTL